MEKLAVLARLHHLRMRRSEPCGISGRERVRQPIGRKKEDGSTSWITEAVTRSHAHRKRGSAAWRGCGAGGSSRLRLDSIPTASGTFTPLTAYSYNSAGGAVSITHNGTGNYTVTFAGLGNGQNSNVEVTAYGSSGRFCQSEGWSSSNGTDVVATVLCFTPAGVPANNSFTLMYELRTSADHVPDQAFVFADQPTATSYTPSLTYQYVYGGAIITITRNGTGNYTVLIPRFLEQEAEPQNHRLSHAGALRRAKLDQRLF